MVNFFRDILNGPLYVIVVIFAIIFIMAIIGFMMERTKKEKESKEKVAFVSQNAQVPKINKEGIPQDNNENK